MASKKAASMKPVDKAVIDKIATKKLSPEESFDEAKKGLTTIAESYLKNSCRPDKVLEDFNMALNFKDILGDKVYTTALTMSAKRNAAYRSILSKLKDMSFDKMIAENWEDPFSDMVRYIDVSSEPKVEDILTQWAEFETVRPFGEKVEQMRISLTEMTAEK